MNGRGLFCLYLSFLNPVFIRGRGKKEGHWFCVLHAVKLGPLARWVVVVVMTTFSGYKREQKNNLNIPIDVSYVIFKNSFFDEKIISTGMLVYAIVARSRAA